MKTKIDIIPVVTLLEAIQPVFRFLEDIINKILTPDLNKVNKMRAISNLDKERGRK